MATKKKSTVPLESKAISPKKVKKSSTPEIVDSSKLEKLVEELKQKTEDLQTFLENSHGLTGHPRASVLWNCAWEKGHAYGESEVEIVYKDLADIISNGRVSRDDIQIINGFATHIPTGFAVKISPVKVGASSKSDLIKQRLSNAKEVSKAVDKVMQIARGLVPLR